MPGTVKFHRVLKAPPARVYKAFLDADGLARWLPPNGFTCKVHRLDARVGGTFKMSFTNFTTGNGHSFGGEYLELVPNEKLRYTDKFDDPNLTGSMEVTVMLKKVSVGTEINIVQSRHSGRDSRGDVLSRLAGVAGLLWPSWSSRRFLTEDDPSDAYSNAESTSATTSLLLTRPRCFTMSNAAMRYASAMVGKLKTLST